MKQLQFAIIGYGGMGSYHATTIMPQSQELVAIKGVYDLLSERNEAAKADGFFAYGSLQELLADEKIEAVLIATPNDSHKDLAIAALKAGKHVVCEKPVAMNTAELDEILAVAESVEKVFMVHQNRRWDPDFLLIRKLYQEKPLGDLFQIESRVQGANGIPGDWRHLKKHGGGMLLDWGVHLFDQLLFLIDSPIKYIHTDLSYILGDEVDDGFHSYLTFENGVKVIIEVGTTNYVTLPRWYVKGLNGTAKISDWALNGEIMRRTQQEIAAPKPIQAGVGLTKTMAPPQEEATEKLAFPKVESPYPSFYANFYDVVVHNATPIVKNSEVRRVLSLLESILAAGKD